MEELHSILNRILQVAGLDSITQETDVHKFKVAEKALWEGFYHVLGDDVDVDRTL